MGNKKVEKENEYHGNALVNQGVPWEVSGSRAKQASLIDTSLLEPQIEHPEMPKEERRVVANKHHLRPLTPS